MDNLSEEVNSSEGLSFFPFGNGSEGLFNHNKNLNAMINGLDFNSVSLCNLRSCCATKRLSSDLFKWFFNSLT